MDKYPKPMTKNITQKILNQIGNSVYKINEKNRKFFTGFLCYIKYQNENIPVLITTYKGINEKYLANKNSVDISINNENIRLEFGNINYLNQSLDLSIIEIKENSYDNLKFLELDDCLYEKDSELLYYKETIYIIHYNDIDKNNYVSYGVLNDINGSELICSCNINSDSNGSPIFNIYNNKLIGIYKNTSNYYAKGIFFKFVIDEFIKEFKNTKNNFKYNKNMETKENEIKILINIEQKDIGKNIYFLDNFEYEDNMGIRH